MKHFWQLLVLALLVACQPVTAVPIPTSVPTLETPVHYELRQPQIADLLEMINSVLLMEGQMTYQENVITYILEREPSSLQYLIGEDFKRYYLNGFPGADDLVIQNTLPWELRSFGDLNSFSPILQIAVLQYINNHQDVLESGNSIELPNSHIRMFSLDLNGDQDLEWLIGVEYQDYSLQNWLLIKKQINGFYELLSGIDYDWMGASDAVSDIKVRDLTGDGNPEIIKSQYHYLAGGVHGNVDIYTWDGIGVKLLKSIELQGVPPIYGEVFASEYKIDDFDGDGVADIQVNWPRFRRFDCEWVQTSTYYLDGRRPDVEVEGEEIPQTDECLIARALEHENLVDQIPFYKDALRKFVPNTSSIDKLAWIKLQLTMAYTANGEDDLALVQLRDLINTTGEGKFLKFIQDRYIENNSPSPLIFCDALNSSIATQIRPESIGSEIDKDLTYWAYPVDFVPIADFICPFSYVLRERLNILRISSSELPIEVLTRNGYVFTWSQTMNWDVDLQDEWLGVLNFNQPMLLIMDSREYWRLESVEINLTEISEYDSVVYNPTNGSGTKALTLFSGIGKYCDSPKVSKMLVEINAETMGYDTHYLCDMYEYSLADESDVQYAIETFSKPNHYEPFEAPNWYYLPEYNADLDRQKTILDLVNELEDKVVIVGLDNYEEVASEISSAIDSLPDDQAAQLLLSRLYYLRGLNYELSKQDDLAVVAYLELIEFSPESLWIQYAKIRIQPIQP